MRTLPRRLVDRLPGRTVAAARRAATATGLLQVRALGDAVEQLTESVRETAGLEPALERRIAEIERSLVPVLLARAKRDPDGPTDHHAASAS